MSVKCTFCNHSVTAGIDWLVSRGVAGSSGVESTLDSSSDEVSLTDGSSSVPGIYRYAGGPESLLGETKNGAQSVTGVECRRCLSG